MLDTIDFPRVVNAAYADGARVFIEVGPGASCTRMIGSILAGKPHLARSACVPRQDAVSAFLRLLADLHAGACRLTCRCCTTVRRRPPPTTSGPTITCRSATDPEPVRGTGFQPVQSRARGTRAPVPVIVKLPAGPVENLSYGPAPAVSPVVVLAETQTATLQAHEAYLRFAAALQAHFAQTVAWQTTVLQQAGSVGLGPAGGPLVLPVETSDDGIPRSLDFEQCMEFARGLGRQRARPAVRRGRRATRPASGCPTGRSCSWTAS